LELLRGPKGPLFHFQAAPLFYFYAAPLFHIRAAPLFHIRAAPLFHIRSGPLFHSYAALKGRSSTISLLIGQIHFCDVLRDLTWL
jgi:hypothetical protein